MTETRENERPLDCLMAHTIQSTDVTVFDLSFLNVHVRTTHTDNERRAQCGNGNVQYEQCEFHFAFGPFAKPK